jgi:ABC-type sugar transport system ATPase subunit
MSLALRQDGVPAAEIEKRVTMATAMLQLETLLDRRYQRLKQRSAQVARADGLSE